MFSRISVILYRANPPSFLRPILKWRRNQIRLWKSIFQWKSYRWQMPRRYTAWIFSFVLLSKSNQTFRWPSLVLFLFQESELLQPVTVLTCNDWACQRNEEPPIPGALVSLWIASEKISRIESPTLVICRWVKIIFARVDTRYHICDASVMYNQYFSPPSVMEWQDAVFTWHWVSYWSGWRSRRNVMSFLQFVLFADLNQTLSSQWWDFEIRIEIMNLND